MTTAELVSIAIAVSGVILTIYFFFKSRRLKRLQVFDLNTASVFEVRESVPELKVLHRDRQINELWVLEFTLKNTGTLDLEEADVENSPIRCRTDAEIVDARVMQRAPKDLPLDISGWNDDLLTLKSGLFKRGEFAKIKVTLLSKPSLDFRATRIRDLGPIPIVQTSKRKPLAWATMVLAGLALSSAIYSLLLLRRLPPELIVKCEEEGRGTRVEGSLNPQNRPTKAIEVACTITNPGSVPVDLLGAGLLSVYPDATGDESHLKFIRPLDLPARGSISPRESVSMRVTLDGELALDAGLHLFITSKEPHGQSVLVPLDHIGTHPLRD